MHTSPGIPTVLQGCMPKNGNASRRKCVSGNCSYIHFSDVHPSKNHAVVIRGGSLLGEGERGKHKLESIKEY